MSPIRVITVGVEAYPHQPDWNLSLTPSTTLVRDELAKHGVTAEDRTSVAVHQGHPSIREFMRELQTPDAPCLLYWTGHGDYSDDGYYAALADSQDPLDSTNSASLALFKETLVNRSRLRGDDDESDWFIVVLDTCGSCQGALQIVRELKGGLPRNTAIIATSSEDGTAEEGAFAALLQDKLQRFREEPEIQVLELVRRLEDSLNSRSPGQHVHAYLLPSATLPRRSDMPTGLTTTVDSYNELAAVLADADETTRNHFFAKAQGAEIGEPAWYFTGRESARRQLIQWLDETSSGLFAVTGVAGCGKSALLGMLLASANPAMTAALAQLGYPAPTEDLLPPANVFDAALHLSGATVDDILPRLARAMGIPHASDADALAREGAAALEGRCCTILLDALDESRDALTIAALLRRLSSIQGLRLIVGTRQSLHEDPDHPQPPDRDVLTALGADEENTLVLDREPSAIKEYTKRRLRRLLAGHVPNTQIVHLAGRIAATTQPFLFARLAVHELQANPHLATPAAESELEALLRSGHTGLFAHAIARLKHMDPKVEALLHALAYARGNGLPQHGGIWTATAEAISGLTITDDSVSRTLDAAAPYIMQGEEFGRTVYRLAHRTFTERYRLDDDAQQ